MTRKYNWFLTIFLVIIISGILVLLGFIIFNKVSENHRNSDASSYVDEFKQIVKIEDEKEDDVSINNSTEEISGENEEIIDNGLVVDNTSTTSSSNKKKKQYKGYDVLGTIEISKTKVKLPVLANLTVKSLETSVVAIWPEPEATLNSTRNVVIVGHNYRNGTFFSNNKKLSNNDKIKITDLEGNTITYNIYKIFETTDVDTSFYNRDTQGKREITLSTCTDDASRRLIIQAVEQ